MGINLGTDDKNSLITQFASKQAKLMPFLRQKWGAKAA
jgi:hypothetical protein|nr:MAG TPA: hypothetical protein [Inoviridae sp.]